MYKIVILTDSNRRYLETLMTNNLLEVLHQMSIAQHTQLTSLSRIVYEETFATENGALDRLKTLQNFTRMQKERLLRKQNPNWLNLHPVIKPSVSNYNPTLYAS